MRLTVLGSAGTHVGRGRMCTSHLVEHDGYRLLLDCGNGSLSNLAACVDVADVDAVLLSHLHVDHFADIYSLYYALRLHPSGPRSVPLYAPAGAQEHLARLMPAESRSAFASGCPVTEATVGDVLHLGPLTATLFGAAHPIEVLAPRIEADGQVLSYSGDSGECRELVDAARDADLFVCDASWRDRDGPHPPGLHMTGRQAGSHAARAGAHRLLTAHVLPTNEPEDVAEEARAVYDGEVIAAHDLVSVDLDGGDLSDDRGAGVEGA